MSSLRDLSTAIDEFRNKQNAMTVQDKKVRKYAATSKAPSYPDIDMRVVGMRQPALSRSVAQEPSLVGGGRKVKRMNAPPAVKKALKSVGKQTVKALGSIGQDGLDVATGTSHKLAEKAPDLIADAVVQAAMSGGSEKQKRKPSAWIQHVKAYAKTHNLSYKDAMSQAKASYHK
jgi:hypothetical protein